MTGFGMGVSAMSRFCTGLLILGLLVPGMVSCGSIPGDEEDGGIMDFNAVDAGVHTSNECTPDIAEDFIGLRINAPEKVTKSVDKFMICGTHQFAADYVYGFDDIIWSIVIVVVDAASHEPYSCNLISPGDSPERGDPIGVQDPDWMKGHTIQGFFNVDLFEIMENLPDRDGDYIVYAIIEEHASEAVRVSVKAGG